MIKIVTKVVENWSKITSGDPIQTIEGVVEIIGSVGLGVGGPYGPLIAAGCGLVSSVLLLCTGSGNKKTSLQEQIKSYIDEAFKDFSDEVIRKEVNTAIIDIKTDLTLLLGIAQYNGGLIKNGEAALLNVDNFVTTGNNYLGAYKTQLDKYRTKNDDDEKSRLLALYTYYYALVCNLKQIMLTLLCCLLKMNGMNTLSFGVHNYQTNELTEQGKELLSFMSDIPNRDPKKDNNYWKLYRYLHIELNQKQRSTITSYRKYLGLDPMPGKLCTIYNIYRNEYIFASQNWLGNNDHLLARNRGRFVAWADRYREGNCIWRIFDAPNGGKYIFNVFFSEYMYVSGDFHGYFKTYVETSIIPECTRGVKMFYGDKKRRLVFTYMQPNDYGEIPYDEAEWKIEGDWENSCIVINRCYEEPLYASSFNDATTSEDVFGSNEVFGAEKGAYLCFTWSPKNIEEDCKWIIKECPYETTRDLNEAYKS